MGKGFVDAPAMPAMESRNEAGDPSVSATSGCNVTVAMNYSLLELDHFVSHGREPALYEPSTNSNVDSYVEEIAGQDRRSSDKTTVDDYGSQTRRPKRKRTPKKAAVEKAMVRYDMSLTPSVSRNIPFLHVWRVGEASTPGNEETELSSSPANRPSKGQSTLLRASKRLRQKKPPEDSQAAHESGAHRVLSDSTNLRGPCEACRHFPFCSRAYPEEHKDSHPFLGDMSVIWVPSSRSEWDDCVDEMTAVCTEASLRRHAVESAAWESNVQLALGETRGRGRPKGKPGKPPSPPLSRDYIRDRIDIDDPLRGYQIRHRTGGWLQGFVLTTTFTTWTHYFKWDSTHPKSGMRSVADPESSKRPGWDHGGVLSAELEKQPRGGDPLHSGVIWPTVAEISVVGALGCGEYLLRMALDDILRRDCYDFVVLQATDSSRTFYERFGFVRVGAVTKYGSAEAFADQQQPQQKPSSALPVVGYRHWTYADETTHRLSKHGGPSYMMAVRVGRSKKDPNGVGHHCAECRRAIVKASFLDALSDSFVHEKPKIIPTGGVLGRKAKATVADTPAGGVAWKPPSAGLSGVQQIGQPKPTTLGKRVHVQADPGGARIISGHSSTCTKLSEEKPAVALSKLEKSASNNEDIWLAVPPVAKPETPMRRKAPRPRGNILTMPSPMKKTPDNRSSQGLDVKANGTTVSKVIQNQQLKKPSTSPGRKCTLRKQRIPAMYRDPNKVYFYNKVVTPKKKSNLRSSTRPYYFVLHYHEEEKMIRIIPLVAKGKFDAGKRAGRVRWKATTVDEEPKPSSGSSREEQLRQYFESMGVKTVSCLEWDIVPAHATNKGTGVAEESWDIFD